MILQTFFVTAIVAAQLGSSQGTYDAAAALGTNNPASYALLMNSTPAKEQKFLDNSINDSTYIIGGGDQFRINIPKTSTTYDCVVNENGDLEISEIGIISIGEVSLAKAKQLIIENLTKRLNKEVYVSLIETKVATFQVTGNVLAPGTYKQSGTFRILDAIRLANNNAFPDLTKDNYREVECFNKGEIKYLDLFSYYYKGDQSQNPYIYPGDEIKIKSAERSIFMIGEFGTNSEIISIKKNEQLKDFLSGLTFGDSADLENIIVKRMESLNNEKMFIFNLQAPQDILLKDKDIVTIPRKKNYPDVFMVTMNGEVASPGKYPIIRGSTKAKQIIEQAGGAIGTGNIKRAVIIRSRKTLSQNVVLSGIRPEVSSSLATLKSLKDNTVIPYGNGDVLLEPEDKIFVPHTDMYVYVSGSVNMPGGIPYVNGKNCEYYLNKAGGTTKNADKTNITVLSNYDQVTVVKGKKNVEDGDVIIVPVSQQNKLLSTVILPIITAFATTVSLILAIYSTAKNQ